MLKVNLKVSIGFWFLEWEPLTLNQWVQKSKPERRSSQTFKHSSINLHINVPREISFHLEKCLNLSKRKRCGDNFNRDLKSFIRFTLPKSEFKIKWDDPKVPPQYSWACVPWRESVRSHKEALFGFRKYRNQQKMQTFASIPCAGKNWMLVQFCYN